MNKALLKELLELPPADRIDLAMELWGSIALEDMPPLTAEQMAELDQRLADSKEIRIVVRPGRKFEPDFGARQK
jgi:putative addiction module component (TIGR02574 family)